ncbi:MULTISPECIES: hypothetical protein [unclassified Methylophaga]|jgi:hypothetical protein|uniref:hypothetical protein n=1 Tax=unclassified Methylophaga TaxID=2629249 RepID=UPI000C8C3DC7|nr:MULTISPECIES: hypothetical protein [unclassified Methylophaga]MAK67496.1 hypothetical protein [Methylophaga sp.]MAY18729.1 hypothetical protein [Methylophaga sp.]HAO25023.1 hypothetical protein [Methylophaga sp.]HCD04481.1 hypothetical protein [Methylophaga sp.]|tara:strand:+ start:11971 stop:12174 length:204 start_codon:yes stop_codon:yes gene_type:complete
MSNEKQQAKLDDVLDRFYDKFGFYPFFSGFEETLMVEDRFINKLENAIQTNDPEIDISDYFPDGENL